MPRRTKYKGFTTRRERKEKRENLELSQRKRAPKIPSDTANALSSPPLQPNQRTIAPTVSTVVKPVNGLTPLQEVHATLDKRERCSIRVLSQFISWFIFPLRLSVRMKSS